MIASLVTALVELLIKYLTRPPEVIYSDKAPLPLPSVDVDPIFAKYRRVPSDGDTAVNDANT